MKPQTAKRAARAAIACATLTLAMVWPVLAQGKREQNPASRTPETKSRRKDASSAQRFSTRVTALLETVPNSKGQWGLLVMDAQSGEILYEQNADKYFLPASNMKLFTTAWALAKLGPDYRFHTTLETHGRISAGGTLEGDLFLVGRGDPNLSNRKFPYQSREEFDGPPEKVIAELAEALVAKGLKEIHGDVLGDDSYFPAEPYPDGWEIGDMVWGFGAAISAIVVEDNTVTLTLTPGERAGDPVEAAIVPPTPDFSVENQVITSAAEVKPDLTLRREPGSRIVRLRGTLAVGATPRKLVLGIHEPAEHAAALLARLLIDKGVTVSGMPRAAHQPEPLTAEPRAVLAEHLSVPLGDAVKLVNKISQNLHAEVLLRDAARKNGVWSRPDELTRLPLDFYAAAGIAPEDVLQSDGSGLSRRDLVTPRAVVKLLKYAQDQPWFGVFLDSLPVASVDGTLETLMKNTPASGKIHAKTGSVEHVRTRSGFAETPGGRRLIFSFLGNNQGGKDHQASDALDGMCIAMIEEFERKPPAHKKR